MELFLCWNHILTGWKSWCPLWAWRITWPSWTSSLRRFATSPLSEASWRGGRGRRRRGGQMRKNTWGGGERRQTRQRSYNHQPAHQKINLCLSFKPPLWYISISNTLITKCYIACAINLYATNINRNIPLQSIFPWFWSKHIVVKNRLKLHNVRSRFTINFVSKWWTTHQKGGHKIVPALCWPLWPK